MTGYILRDAGPGDFEDILAINESAYRWYVEKIWGWDPDFQRRYMAEHVDYPNTRMVIVDGAAVGFVAVKPTADSLFLSSVALLPPHRSRGIGTSIIKRVAEEARARGLPLRLEAFKGNVRAHALYRRLGFEPDGEDERHLKFVLRTS